MSFNPKRRYSAVAVMSEDLERVVLIHKLRPDWQAGKANLPGGKVEVGEGIPTDYCSSESYADADHRHCAARELREETGLDVAATALQLFCRLRFRVGANDAECCFYAVKGDVDAARTMEEERVFVDDVGCVMNSRCVITGVAGGLYHIPTMPNLPYLVAMARQCLRGEGAGSWPLTIYDV